MAQAIVLDASGQRLAPCSAEKARNLLAAGGARLVAEDPLTIQLPYRVSLPSRPQPSACSQPGVGKRLLLHICCGPCSTYPINQLREQGFDVTGLWYNPNIQPFAEHERRRQCARQYAEGVGLQLIEWGTYEMPAYFRAVAGHEARGDRCGRCYRLRLERTAQAAQEQGFDAFTTTLLISPYQQQALINRTGAELGAQYGVDFYFENLRRGWSERGRITREHGLYQQHYCGCVYSEWEAADAAARRGLERGAR